MGKVEEMAEEKVALEQWVSGIPKENGFYWVRQGNHTPYIAEFEDGFAFFTGVERCSDKFSDDHRFLGPLQPVVPNTRQRAERAARKLAELSLLTWPMPEGTDTFSRVTDIIAAEFEK